MKKILLTVAMLLSAAGMQAGASIPRTSAPQINLNDYRMTPKQQQEGSAVLQGTQRTDRAIPVITSGSGQVYMNDLEFKVPAKVQTAG